MKWQLDGGQWTEILTSKFFGANDPLTGEIIDGRWKNQKIPYITKEFLVSEGIDPMHTFFPSDESIWYVENLNFKFYSMQLCNITNDGFGSEQECLQ